MNNSKIHKIYLTISIITVATGLLLTHLYRPYVYSNHINDFGFADTIGSLVAVLGSCTFIWSFKTYPNYLKNKQIFTSTILFAVLWEILGLLEIHGVFDWKDIIAGIISGVITFTIKEIVEK